MITAVASTALSIVREKEVGTMEQVRMAPIGTFSFIVGKTIPYFVISLASAALDHPGVDGAVRPADARQLAALLLALSLFLVGALGTGLLISTVADTQQVAFQIALLISFLPTIMLSGFIFPISSMPRGAAGRHLRRAGALLPRRAARHRPQGRRAPHLIGPLVGRCRSTPPRCWGWRRRAARRERA